MPPKSTTLKICPMMRSLCGWQEDWTGLKSRKPMMDPSEDEQ